jgi:hypothetical protein
MLDPFACVAPDTISPGEWTVRAKIMRWRRCGDETGNRNAPQPGRLKGLVVAQRRLNADFKADLD